MTDDRMGLTHPKLFISYSHADLRWLRKIRPHLAPLKSRLEIEIWDDSRIRPGLKWQEEIQQALGTARAALLLLSPDFLASAFVLEEELPTILKRAQHDGVTVLSLILRPCLFEDFSALSQFQSVNRPDAPLSSMSPYQQDRTLVGLALTIQATLRA